MKGFREGEHWTLHRCTGVLSRRNVYLINGTPTFTCSCGDTVFASFEELRRWEGDRP